MIINIGLHNIHIYTFGDINYLHTYLFWPTHLRIYTRNSTWTNINILCKKDGKGVPDESASPASLVTFMNR